jgi:hypothetical protein
LYRDFDDAEHGFAHVFTEQESAYFDTARTV